MIKTNESESPVEALIDLGTATVETKGSFIDDVDNHQQKLPNTSGLTAD